MTLAQRLNHGERIQTLEEKAKAHDKMADQVKEMYDVFDWAKKILGAVKWFRITIIGGAFASLGALAVILTIWEKLSVLLARH